jgi:hypothetical protein
MKSWTPRPFWAGLLIGAGFALFAVWPWNDLILIPMRVDYRFIAFLGLGLVVVGSFLR